MKKYTLKFTPKTNLIKVDEEILENKDDVFLTLPEDGKISTFKVIDNSLIGVRETNSNTANNGEALISINFTEDVLRSEITAEENARKAIEEIADVMTKRARNLIGGFDVTDEQLSRYEDKYKAVLAYEESGLYEEELTLEASLDNLTLGDYCNLIVSLNNQWRVAMTTSNLRIEIGRRALNKLLELKEYSKIYNMIGELNVYDETKTVADLEIIVNKYLT